MRHLLLLLALVWSHAVFAQPGSPLVPRLVEVDGLAASDVTEEEAQELFRRLQLDHRYMGQFSECFQRAHLWSHLLERQSNIVTNKAFLFFTYKFQMRHRVVGRTGRPFTWWFHVAPTVRVNGELWALDATFTDRAMPVQEWATSLMRNPEECVETPINQLRNYVDDRNVTEGYRHVSRAREQCYLVNTSRFVYQPLNLGLFERDRLMRLQAPHNLTGWTNNYLTWALNAYTNRQHREATRRAMGLPAPRGISLDELIP